MRCKRLLDSVRQIYRSAMKITTAEVLEQYGVERSVNKCAYVCDKVRKTKVEF